MKWKDINANKVEYDASNVNIINNVESSEKQKGTKFEYLVRDPFTKFAYNDPAFGPLTEQEIQIYSSYQPILTQYPITTINGIKRRFNKD